MPSEIATIKEQIMYEYTAAQLGLFGLASGTTRHRWITARQERLGVLHEQLQHIVGESAIMIVSDMFDRIPHLPRVSRCNTCFAVNLATQRTPRICSPCSTRCGHRLIY